MSSWVKVVPVAETLESGSYFIARAFGADPAHPSYSFWSRNLAGKELWSSKPGLGIHYRGGSGLIKTFAKNTKIALIAIEVPNDWEKRWRRRKHRFGRKF